MKLPATYGFPKISLGKVIKGGIKEEMSWIETHLLLGKIVDEEKEPAENIWHLIVYNAILHWS